MNATPATTKTDAETEPKTEAETEASSATAGEAVEAAPEAIDATDVPDAQEAEDAEDDGLDAELDDDEPAPVRAGFGTGAAAVVGAALGAVSLSGTWMGKTLSERQTLIGQIKTAQSSTAAQQIQEIYGNSWHTTALVNGVFALLALAVGGCALARPAFGTPGPRRAAGVGQGRRPGRSGPRRTRPADLGGHVPGPVRGPAQREGLRHPPGGVSGGSQPAGHRLRHSPPCLRRDLPGIRAD
ncbi:hypothetical protein [Streptomyces sp. NPDC050485]|uniref:hypothetical protein n=1 Tax=Streptomyces sp. NPDC050485 TaxID=3365617 RepID=UPI0037A589A3